MIEDERIRLLNQNSSTKGEYVLYWMQASQRVEYNHALEYAIKKANERKQPLLVFFGLMTGYPEANQRHYRFMLEGLREVETGLRERGIGFLIRQGNPWEKVTESARNASLVVCDRGYLRHQRQWRQFVAEHSPCQVVQVESDVVVPVETASIKEEYSAATIRRKLLPLIPKYLVPFDQELPVVDSTGSADSGISLSDIDAVLWSLPIDDSVSSVTKFTGGTDAAKKLFKEFIETKLEHYDSIRNDPTEEGQSGMSPYLHFGQISPLYLVHEVNSVTGPAVEAFLEELVIRREVSMNYVTYNQYYDSFEGLPDWSKKTLAGHRDDPRPYVYSRDELEQALTHDRYWNAAQREMVRTGKMHGYMRMYWGKKILEWSDRPEEAYRTALFLNNKYELDGRDPNGYTGIAWCFGKHDRPWATRSVFGSVRYMNANGLRRKFDADRYARMFSL